MKQTVYENKELMKFWDLSNTIDPKSITCGSTRMARWHCFDCKQVYEMKIAEKNRGYGCPICSGKRVVTGINDLKTIESEICLDWDYDENYKRPEEYTRSSNDLVAWKCHVCGYKWKATINNRTGKRRTGCPNCSGKVVIKGKNDLLTLYPKIANKWDFSKNSDTPDQYTPKSNVYKWWLCPFGHSYRQRIYNTVTAQDNNCDICKKKRIVPGINDLFTEHPYLKQQWSKNNSVDPNYIHSGMQKNKYLWNCPKCGGEWLATPYSRAIMKSGCPYCVNQATLPGKNDLATLLPEILDYWDYDRNIKKPTEIPGKKSNQKVNLKCPVCGHEWGTKISDFAKGNRCPNCSKGKRMSFPEKVVFYYFSKFFEDAQENAHFDSLRKQELDIFIPSLNLAIEYDGVYWHQNVSNDYKKDEMCHLYGITLIRFREEGCPDYYSHAIKITCPVFQRDINALEYPINMAIREINRNLSLMLPFISTSKDDEDKIRKLLIPSKALQ